MGEGLWLLVIANPLTIPHASSTRGLFIDASYPRAPACAPLASWLTFSSARRTFRRARAGLLQAAPFARERPNRALGAVRSEGANMGQTNPTPATSQARARYSGP